jgi:hypothetical protein
MKRFRILGPRPLNHYCTKHKPCTYWFPDRWGWSTAAEYVAIFIARNNLIG